MDTERRKLITPVTLETKDYAREWQSIQYTPKPIGPAISNHLTDKAETVRSKSEVIIANTLARQQIPYRYEYPVKLKTYTAHPDFYCLNLRTRQEYLWEHLGMLTNPEYAALSAKKILDYQTSGYIIGKNLILTFETETLPFSQKQAKLIIETFLK